MRFKSFNFAIFVVLFVIFLVQIVILNRPDNCLPPSPTPIPLNPNSLDTTPNLTPQDTRALDPNTWIINNKVAQYGSKLILLPNDDLIVEALAFFDFTSQTRDYVKSSAVQCLMKIDSMVYKLAVTDAIPMDSWISVGGRRFLWRVRCQTQKRVHQSKFSDIKVAITHTDDYARMVEKHKPEAFIWFHKPNFYDSKIPKKKAISHCVHMMFDLYGVRLRRFFDWFEVQKRLGVDRFRLYFFRVNKTSEDSIRERVGQHVEIFHTQLGKDFVCRHYIAHLKENPSEISQYLLNNCENLFKLYFDWSREGVFNVHEKVCTNDCLLNFKWQYEFTSNYDFDEFIFPRKDETSFNGQLKVTDCSSKDRTPDDYKLYDYAVALSKSSSAKIAVLRFKHVVFMHNDHKNFLDQLLQINLANKSNQIKLDYNYMKMNKRISFRVSQDHQNYIEQIKSAQPLIECLNQTIRKNSHFDQVWNSVYAIEVDNRFGKSIYNTDLTETYNQHFADVVSPGSIIFDVNLKDGYASHFREYVDGFFYNQEYPLNKFFVDLEFYKYLAMFK